MSSKKCAYCGEPTTGNYTIHRDGFGVGPEVTLCDECGEDETPSCEQIWDKIAKPSSETMAYRSKSSRVPRYKGNLLN